jgi:two-component system, NarL family, nitrate/nitrite response regulator NarL
MVRILIIDNNILFREGLSNLLHKEGGVIVVAGADSLDDAVTIVKTHHPDIALMDADLLNQSSVNGIQHLREERPALQIIVFSAHQSEEQFLNMLRSGARGYLSKNSSLSTLMACIRAIERGEVAIPRAMVNVLLDEFCRLTPVLKMDGVDLLTPRELGVLNELGNGHSNREIAEKLRIAENTVKVHVHNILEKLNLDNRRQAARFARARLAQMSMDQHHYETMGTIEQLA